jgi:hypothetical protein
MKYQLTTIILTVLFFSCENNIEKSKKKFLVNDIPYETPIDFKKDLIPANMIIHKGIFSPELKEFFYTVSDKDFQQFSVYVIEKINGEWSSPSNAFFDSNYNEHGMSFSQDGNTIYFSSTRPVPLNGVSSTWHIWKSEKIKGTWGEPTFIDIPNLRNRLTSHPVVSETGTMYFHSSNLDYTEMNIYYSKQKKGKYENAKKVSFLKDQKNRKCTPFVSPNEDYLIFASIGNQLDLMISFNEGNGHWSKPRLLNKKINDMGQGNPFVTQDNKYLFFTMGDRLDNDWKIKWVNIESELTR